MAAINANDVAAMQVIFFPAWQPLPYLVSFTPSSFHFVRAAALTFSTHVISPLLVAILIFFLQRYVERKMDCNLHTGVYPPLTVAGTLVFRAASAQAR